MQTIELQPATQELNRMLKEHFGTTVPPFVNRPHLLITRPTPMLRNSWLFGYSSEHVHAAAQARADHHLAREQHYQAEVERVLSQIRAEGITIDEEPDHSGHTSYFQPSVRIDPELQNRLDDAQRKLVHHRGKRIEYVRWEKALAGTHVPHLLDLHIDDVEYFGLT